MPRQRSPNRDKAKQMYLESGKTLLCKGIAKILNVSESQVRNWKAQDNWDNKNKVEQSNENSCAIKRKKGAQPKNKNSKGHVSSVPKGNKNAETHGFFSKIFPPETIDIMDINNILAIGGVLVGVIGITLFLFPYLKSRKVNVDKAIDTVQQGTDTADAVLSAVGKILPGNPVVNVLEVINKWGRIAAGYAEQLYHAGNIGKDERAQVAETVALNVLKELDIPVDDNKKALIDAAIKNAVNDLGHAPVSEAEKNAQIAKTQQDMAAVQSENAQLKQKLTTIQNTVGTIQNTNTQVTQPAPSTTTAQPAQ